MLRNLVSVLLWCVFVYCEIDNLSDDIILIREDKCGEAFDFSNMGIMVLKTKFLNSLTVTELDLSKNNIWKIEKGAFDGLPNLKHLNFTENVFLFQHLRDNDFPSIETLILDNAVVHNVNADALANQFYNGEDHTNNYQEFMHQCNKIRDYKKRNQTSHIYFDASMKFPKLKRLYLRQNKIELLMFRNLDSLNQIMPKLTHLYLSENNFTAINLDNLSPTLTHLYLDNNKISQLTIESSNNSFKVLNINGNQFNELCGHCSVSGCNGILLEKFPQLEYFSIENVGLKDISANAFWYSFALVHLIMSRNKISQIENGTFHDLVNLKTLILDNNQLSALPDLSKLKNLELFSIARNKISSLRKFDFDKLENLKSLNLSFNDLSEIIPGTFNGLESLEILDLSGNKLQTLSTFWISPRTKLECLFLHNNLFSSFSNLPLIAIKNLRYVSIAENPLPSIIDAKSLMSLSDNVTLDISGDQIFELHSNHNYCE